MDTSAAQIQAWLLAASVGTCIDDDLLEHGHALAAACQSARLDVDALSGIIAEVERVTPDNEKMVAGIVISGGLVSPWMVDQATPADSQLRSGYLFVGWDPSYDRSGLIIRNCRESADGLAIAALAKLNTTWNSDSGGASACHELILGSSLEFVLGYEGYLVRALWAQLACSLAARDILSPEIALSIALLGARDLDRATVVELDMGTVLADAFERRRQSQTPVLMLPPVII